MGSPVQTLIADPQFQSLSPDGQRKAIRGVGGNDFATLSDTGIDKFISGMSVRPTEAQQAAEVVPRTLAQSRAVSQRVPIAGAERGGQFRAESGAYTPTEEERPLPSAAGPPAALPAPPTTFVARALDEAKRIGHGLLAPPDTAFGQPFNPIGTAQNVAGAVKTRGQEFAQHPAAATGATVTDVAAAAAPFVAHEALGRISTALEPHNIRVGTEKVGKGLGIPSSEEAVSLAGKSAPEGINAASDLQLVQKDLATIERKAPVTAKGSAGTFARAKNILDYNAQLWEDAHAAPISRNVNLPINEQNLMAAGQKALPAEAMENAPSGGKQAQRWLQSVAGKSRSLGSADALLREINADIEANASSAKPYPPLVVRTKMAVAEALRKEIETTLTGAGEQGVAEANQRYGALRNIAERMIDAGLAEAKSEGKRAGITPKWFNVYTFMHTGGISEGLSVHPSAMFPSKSSKHIGAGMSRLAGTSLEPPPNPSAPQPRLPAPPDTSGPIPGAMGPSAYSWNPPGPAPPSGAGAPEVTGTATLRPGGGTAENPSALGAGGKGGVRIRGMLPAPPPESVTPPRVSGERTAIGTMQPVALGPFQPPTSYGGQRRPPARYLPALPERAGVSPGTSPPTGIVGSTFKQLGLTDLVTPRQQTTLETMLRGPRWKDMDSQEKVQAIRSILSGERFP
jgi:hypothetical protein